MHPTIISAGAVAAKGIALTKVARNALSTKQIAVTTEVRPVRPAGSDSGSALHESGGVGCSEDRTDGSRRSVCKQGPVHLGAESGTGLQHLLIFLGEDTRALSCSDKGTDGVKGIGHAEGKDRDQHQRQTGEIREQGRKSRGCEDHAKGGRQRGKRIREADRVRRGCHAEGDSDDRSHNDGNQDTALHFLQCQNDSQKQSDQKYPQTRCIDDWPLPAHRKSR